MTQDSERGPMTGEEHAVDVLRELGESVDAVMGLLNYCVGPAARAGASRDQKKAYERLVQARETARALTTLLDAAGADDD